jgi:hypothetical protein
MVETFKDFKRARSKGKYIVSPWWLTQCKESMRRLPEDQFPHTYNPKCLLEVAPGEPLPTTENESLMLSTATSSSDTNSTMSIPQPPISNISTLMGRITPVSELRRFRTSALIKKHNFQGSLTETKDHEPVHTEDHSLTAEDSFSGVVYDDPESKREKRKLMDRLELKKRLKIDHCEPQEEAKKQDIQLLTTTKAVEAEEPCVQEEQVNTTSVEPFLQSEPTVPSTKKSLPENETLEKGPTFQTEATEPITVRDMTVSTSKTSATDSSGAKTFKFMLSSFSAERKSKITKHILYSYSPILVTQRIHVLTHC